MKEIEKILKDRGGKYGPFSETSRITQAFMRTMETGKSFDDLSDEHREAIYMIFHKLSRALSGDSNLEDNFQDIIGYSQLLLDSIRKTNTEKPSFNLIF